MWIVEIEQGCWLAPWTGDPGRTLVRENSKQYKSEGAAKWALNRAKGMYPFRDFSQAMVVPSSVLDR